MIELGGERHPGSLVIALQGGKMLITRSNSLIRAAQVLPMIRTLDTFYPEVSHWYVSTVMPGIVAGKDTLLLAMDGSQIVGFALGKRATDETKLRCIRVLPSHQNTGVGLKLIDRMLEELECEKPHCSVAEEMLHAYSRAFVHRYGFELSAVDKGAYRAGKLEYRFN